MGEPTAADHAMAAWALAAGIVTLLERDGDSEVDRQFNEELEAMLKRQIAIVRQRAKDPASGFTEEAALLIDGLLNE